MKIIIIGGVAGGATTAARIRRTNEAAEIILLEKGKYISYANCGLPYYIGGVIKEREKLFVQTPEAFSTRFRVDVRTENEVIFIDRSLPCTSSPAGNRPERNLHTQECSRHRPNQRIYQQSCSPKGCCHRSRIYRAGNGREPARTRS